MERKHGKILGIALVAALWLGLAVMAWCRPADAVSVSERRPLAQFPELSAQALLNGEFVSDFESYTLDQFPLRSAFRAGKALFQHYGLFRQDNNGIYLQSGQLAQLEYPLNEASVDHALKVFQTIYNKYLRNARVYAAVVPDKGYYLASANGYPAMDYERLFQKVQAGMPYASYVNLEDLLSAQDYYTTDTHWRQEVLLPTANRLLSAMGAQQPENMTARMLEKPFYGVYYGQAALPVPPDRAYVLESPWLSQCRVFHYETGKYAEVYDLDKLEGDDPYEVFLSGSVSLLRIENPAAQTDRGLIVFRDSFGSSLAPLLCQGYRTVTLVDVRYISSALLDRFIDFQNQDVLFLYSTLVLNNASTLS